MRANIAASLTHVVKRYGEKLALDDLTLGVEAGQVTALLGPNGAGKSTAMSLLLGLTRAEEGEVRVLGGLPGALEVRRRTGVMLQSAALPDTLKVGRAAAAGTQLLPAPRPACRGRRAGRRRGAPRYALCAPLRRAAAARAVRAGRLWQPAAAVPGRADDRARHRGARVHCGRWCASSPGAAARFC